MSNASDVNGYPTVADLLGLLDRWRHLPAYQLERRADIFFGLFLPEVLDAHLSVEINRTLIPEFPIKKKSSNQSEKVDYFALSADGKRAFLVELKTDMDSMRGAQYAYLDETAKRGSKELVKGVLDICLATKKRHKYVHLLKLLSDIGLIEQDGAPLSAESGYVTAVQEIKGKVEQTKNEDWPSLDVVYIHPRSTDTIGFEEFAGIIERGGQGDIRSSFAERLREWATVDAGSPNPKDWQS